MPSIGSSVISFFSCRVRQGWAGREGFWFGVLCCDDPRAKHCVSRRGEHANLVACTALLAATLVSRLLAPLAMLFNYEHESGWVGSVRRKHRGPSFASWKPVRGLRVRRRFREFQRLPRRAEVVGAVLLRRRLGFATAHRFAFSMVRVSHAPDKPEEPPEFSATSRPRPHTQPRPLSQSWSTMAAPSLR